MSKTKTFDVYDEVWVMEGNRPVAKIIMIIKEVSCAFDSKKSHVVYGLIKPNHPNKDRADPEIFYDYDVFKDKESLMNSVFDL